MVNITGLNKADVLATLYNASRPQGMGFLSYDPTPMARETAQAYLDTTVRFDYLQGRVLKLHLGSDSDFDERLYDRDNGDGAAQTAIDALRASHTTNPIEVQAAHVSGKETAAEAAMGEVTKPPAWDGKVFRIGVPSRF